MVLPEVQEDQVVLEVWEPQMEVVVEVHHPEVEEVVGLQDQVVEEEADLPYLGEVGVEEGVAIMAVEVVEEIQEDFGKSIL